MDPSKVIGPSWVELYETYINRKEYKIDCPDQLRLIYINDAKLINEDKMLLVLPVHQEASVRQILIDFLASKSSSNSFAFKMYQNFCLQIYLKFNEKTLDNNSLLYEPEYEQAETMKKYFKFYSNILYTEKMQEYIRIFKVTHKRPLARNESVSLGGLLATVIVNLPTPLTGSPYKRPYDYVDEIDEFPLDMTQIYGAHHLLRFFRYLGRWIDSETEMEGIMLTKFLHCCRLFLNFLNTNPHYFADENSESPYSPAQEWKIEADKYGRRLESNRIWLHKVWNEVEKMKKTQEESEKKAAEAEAGAAESQQDE